MNQIHTDILQHVMKSYTNVFLVTIILPLQKCISKYFEIENIRNSDIMEGLGIILFLRVHHSHSHDYLFKSSKN